MVWGSQKLLDDDAIVISLAVVRVPVFFTTPSLCTSKRRKINAAQGRELLQQAPGVALMDKAEHPRGDRGRPSGCRLRWLSAGRHQPSTWTESMGDG